jgi:hypothetical protein
MTGDAGPGWVTVGRAALVGLLLTIVFAVFAASP